MLKTVCLKKTVVTTRHRWEEKLHLKLGLKVWIALMGVA